MKRIIVTVLLALGMLFTTAPAQADTTPTYPTTYYGNAGWPNFGTKTTVTYRTVKQYRVYKGHLQYRVCKVTRILYYGTVFKTRKCGAWHYTWYAFIR